MTHRELGPPCPNCLKPVMVGQVVLPWDDVGEMHADCERPYRTDHIQQPGCPAPCVLIGDPMLQVPLATFVRPRRAGEEDFLSQLRRVNTDRYHARPRRGSAPAGNGVEEARAIEAECAALIAAYYRREIGTLMQQAEHWAENGKPLAVHHRVMKADDYFQIICLMERDPAKGWKLPFDEIRDALERQPIKGPGAYPPSKDLYRYRDPAFVVAALQSPPAKVEGRHHVDCGLLYDDGPEECTCREGGNEKESTDG